MFMILWYFMFIVDRHVCSQLHNVSHRDAAGQSGESEGDFQKGTDLVAMYRNHERSICGSVLRFPLFSQNPTMAIQ